jgi:hypothetical protein
LVVSLIAGWLFRALETVAAVMFKARAMSVIVVLEIGSLILYGLVTICKYYNTCCRYSRSFKLPI